MLRQLYISALLLFPCVPCFAQQKACEAYWVVETNKKINYSIIRLYDADHNLIEEKRIDGKIVDIRLKRTRRKLDRLIDLYYTQADRVPEMLSQLKGRSFALALDGKRRQSGQFNVSLTE